jgi:hypothetical protein
LTREVDRYDYDAERDWLVVRMPTAVHELFIARVEDAVVSQLKSIRKGSDNAAAFAQKVDSARSTEIRFPVTGGSSGKRSKHEPDASFWHNDAQYPGVIVEVAYSQKKRRLRRLAEDYLLDSDASVQVVVGLDIEYGRKESREATLSVWRSQLHHTDDGVELRVVDEVADEVCLVPGRSWFFPLTSHYRHFVTSKGTLLLTQVYGFNWPTSHARNLQRM